VEVVRVDGFSDLAISWEGMQGEVEVIVKNPNAFDIKAFEADVDVYVGDDKIGTITLPSNQVLKAGSESMLVMDIQSDPGALKKNLSKSVAEPDGRQLN
jgi:LEA14-like dessication related protein